VAARVPDPSAAGDIVAGRTDQLAAGSATATAGLAAQAAEAFTAGLSTTLLAAGLIALAAAVAALLLIRAEDMLGVTGRS
jgi:hypothetical protein